MKIVSNEDWKKVEGMISPWRSVKLKIDGYEVAVTMKIIDKKKVEIFLYIDGVFEFKWLLNDCEIRRKFCYSYRKHLYSRRMREIYKEMSGKAKKAGVDWSIDPDIAYPVYKPTFPSFLALKKHIEKTCKKIELVENG